MAEPATSALTEEEQLFGAIMERLTRTGKIEKAALIDFNGHLLAKSPGLSIIQKDIDALLGALNSPYQSLVKLNVGNSVFTCFRNDSGTNSLIGWTDDDVLTAYKCVDFVVVGVSDPESPGSSIYEMMRFVKQMYRKSRKIKALTLQNGIRIEDSAT